MSALTIILTAAMVVPGDGPEKASGEIKEPQRLDLRGDWLLTYSGGSYEMNGEEFIRSHKLRDEGKGRVRMIVTFQGTEYPLLGIYRQDGERILMCVRYADHGRPMRFQDGDYRILVIFHRVKSSK
jgi:hypothetical protein